MKQKVDFNKKVYSKSQYTKIIDTEFTQLGVKSVQEQIDQQPTVENFFELYNELFYDIPEQGNNSHEYLIQQSTAYIGFEESNDEIVALQNEISELRTQLLDAQKQVIELQTGTSLNIED